MTPLPTNTLPLTGSGRGARTEAAQPAPGRDLFDKENRPMTEIDQIIEACANRPPWKSARKRVESTRIPPPPLVAGGQGREDWTPVETDRVGNFTHGMIVGCTIGAALWVALAYAVWPTLVKIF